MTYRYVIPFPVASGKTGVDAAKIADYFSANMDQYEQSRRQLGTTMERAYLQDTAMGPVVVSYVESDQDFGDWIQGLLDSDLDIDRHFIDMVADIHGVNLQKALDSTPPETIGEWIDPTVETRQQGLAFIAPLLPGKEAAGKAFVHEAFVTRQAELAASRKALGQNAEVVTLNVTPMGSFICVYLEGTNPVEANRRLAASTLPYDVWFKSQLKGLFPASIDFSQPLPPIKTIFSHVEELVTA